ncbi:Hypothetical Protein FCC1311_037072 [Hondaea fermentalgiana]|uniref:PAS domain-containing protein n=1 Tax=Hondaea fermentalgiana TaxID=2315210 RepID=A0A2R5GA76_9STRA|nr:Hypothetical Protein FCC1311_037072 [Hondaea fermentalgiana]|eukprot:GBG27485.1 Hypothetical Protein FCC1311_037072 [Hondaea fermentalgiana]
MGESLLSARPGAAPGPGGVGVTLSSLRIYLFAGLYEVWKKNFLGKSFFQFSVLLQTLQLIYLAFVLEDRGLWTNGAAQIVIRILRPVSEVVLATTSVPIFICAVTLALCFTWLPLIGLVIISRRHVHAKKSMGRVLTFLGITLRLLQTVLLQPVLTILVRAWPCSETSAALITCGTPLEQVKRSVLGLSLPIVVLLSTSHALFVIQVEPFSTSASGRIRTDGYRASHGRIEWLVTMLRAFVIMSVISIDVKAEVQLRLQHVTSCASLSGRLPRVEEFVMDGPVFDAYNDALIDHFSESAYFQLLLASWTLMSRKKMIYGLKRIKAAKDHGRLADQDFVLFCLNMNIRERQVSVGGAASYMEFDRQLHKAKDLILRSLKLMSCFWESVQNGAGIEDLVQSGRSINKASTECRQTIRKLLRMSESSSAAMRWQATFTAYVMNDIPAAINIMSRCSTESNMNSRTGYAVCTISADAASLGKVLEVTEALCQLFGYERSELVGRNVKMLCPEPFDAVHDQFLRHFLESDTSFGTKTRRIYGRNKDGHIIPVDFVITPSTTLESNLILIGTFIERPLQDGTHLLMVNAASLVITGVSEFAVEALRLNYEELYSGNLRITDVIPNFLHRDKSPRYSVERDVTYQGQPYGLRKSRDRMAQVSTNAASRANSQSPSRGRFRAPLTSSVQRSPSMFSSGTSAEASTGKTNIQNANRGSSSSPGVPFDTDSLSSGAQEASVPGSRQIEILRRKLASNLRVQDPIVAAFSRFLFRFNICCFVVAAVNTIWVSRTYREYKSEVDNVDLILEEAHLLALVPTYVFFANHFPFANVVDLLSATASRLFELHLSNIAKAQNNLEPALKAMLYAPTLRSPLDLGNAELDGTSFYIAILDALEHIEDILVDASADTIRCGENCAAVEKRHVAIKEGKTPTVARLHSDQAEMNNDGTQMSSIRERFSHQSGNSNNSGGVSKLESGAWTRKFRSKKRMASTPLMGPSQRSLGQLSASAKAKVMPLAEEADDNVWLAPETQISRVMSGATSISCDVAEILQRSPSASQLGHPLARDSIGASLRNISGSKKSLSSDQHGHNGKAEEHAGPEEDELTHKVSQSSRLSRRSSIDTAKQALVRMSTAMTSHSETKLQYPERDMLEVFEENALLFMKRLWKRSRSAARIGFTYWCMLGHFIYIMTQDGQHLASMPAMAASVHVAGLRFVHTHAIMFYAVQPPSEESLRHLNEHTALVEIYDRALNFGNSSLGVKPFADADGDLFDLNFVDACGTDCVAHESLLSTSNTTSECLAFDLRLGLTFALRQFLDRARRVSSATEVFLALQAEGASMESALADVEDSQVILRDFQGNILLGQQLEQAMRIYTNSIDTQVESIFWEKLSSLFVLASLLVAGRLVAGRVFRELDEELTNIKSLVLGLPSDVFTHVPSMFAILKMEKG